MKHATDHTGTGTHITQIVLLGGGYVTIWAYRSLVKKLGARIENGEIRITVICPEDYHLFHGWTAETITCIIQDKNRMSPLPQLMPKAVIIKGKAEQVDKTASLVYIK